MYILLVDDVYHWSCDPAFNLNIGRQFWFIIDWCVFGALVGLVFGVVVGTIEWLVEGETDGTVVEFVVSVESVVGFIFNYSKK